MCENPHPKGVLVPFGESVVDVVPVWKKSLLKRVNEDHRAFYKLRPGLIGRSGLVVIQQRDL